MRPELISVVVPAYNCGPWLPNCLDSLLVQTYPHMEILVVDDGSLDDTPEILRRYGEKYENIHVFRKENGGVTSARLEGVRQAKGSWIGFVDADDEVEPSMFQMLYQNAIKQNVDISHCGYKVIYWDGRVEYQQNSGLQKRQDRETGLRDLLEEKIMEMSLCSKLFKRELFAGISQVMDPNIKNNEDLLMNYYLFSRAEFAFLEDVCPYHYLVRQGSASRRKLDEHSLFDPILVRQVILDTCGEELKADAIRAQIRMILVSFRALAMEKRGTYPQEQQRLIAMLEEKKQYLSLLSGKNALQVQMILKTPWLYRGLYPLFAGLFR